MPVLTDAEFQASLLPVPAHFGGTGAIPLPPDPRDYPPEFHPAVRAILEVGAPGSADRSAGVCEILNQGATGACVAYSTCHGIQLDYNLDAKVCYHFAAATYYQELGGTGQNGVDSRQTLQRAVDTGAPLVGGGRVKIGSYFRCDNVAGQFEEQIKAAVAAGQCAVIATLLPSTFAGQYTPGVPTQGYHQLEIAGYEDHGAGSGYRRFWGPNSWGAAWGGNRHGAGFYELDFDYVIQQNFLNNYTFAFFFDPTEVHGPDPQPQPQPAPDVTGEMIRRVNATRQQNNLPPLVVSTALMKAAGDYAALMASAGTFSHTGPDGSTPWDRMKKAGFTGNGTWGENIAAGETDPGTVTLRTRAASSSGSSGERWSPGGSFTDWMNSPEHKANILNPAFDSIGAGHATGGPQGHYWVQDFAHTGAGPQPQPQPATVTLSGTVTGTGTANLSVGQTLSAQGAGFVGQIAVSEVSRTPNPDPGPDPGPDPSPGGLTVEIRGSPGSGFLSWVHDAANHIVPATLTATADGKAIGSVHTTGAVPARFLNVRGIRSLIVDAVTDDGRTGRGRWP